MVNSPLSPQPFGRYLLLDRIGVGGMAEIYRAVSGGIEGFRKVVAVKRILSHLASDPSFRGMFINEAKLAALLEHPNVVQIFDLGETDGQLFISMEYVAGLDLAGVLTDSVATGAPLPLGVAAQIGVELLRGLDSAHNLCDARGEPLRLIHRDVSPSNVLVSFEGAVKLGDFGIAKAQHFASHTRTGTIKGKVPYMAPELVDGGTIDCRADIWAAGVVLWEMLAGARLFGGKSDFELIKEISHGAVRPLDLFRPDVPPGVAQVVHRALARDREQRFQSAGDMADALAREVSAVGELLSPVPLRTLLRERFSQQLDGTRTFAADLDDLLSTLPGGPPSAAMATPSGGTLLGHPIADILTEADRSLTPRGDAGSTRFMGTPVADGGVPPPSQPDLAARSEANSDARHTPSAAAATGDSAPRTPTDPLSLEPFEALSRRRRQRGRMGSFLLVLLVAIGLGAGLWAGVWTTLLKPQQTSAMLVVRTSPAGARLSVDGKWQQQATPARVLTLAAGAHDIIVSKAGYAEQRTQVNLEQGGEQELSLQLQALVEDGEPLAPDATGDVQARNKTRPDSGTAATAASDASGTAVAHAVDDAQETATQQPTISPTAAGEEVDEEEEEEEVVQAAPGYVTIFSKPWGYVSIDGVKLQGHTPLRRQAVAPGKHVVEVENPHLHSKQRRDITVRSGKHQRLRFDLSD